MRWIRGAAWALAGLALASVPATAQEAIAGGDLPPPGYGSLKQDNVSLQVTSTDVQVRFLPLDERLIRLLASDAYQSLHGLVESRRSAIDSAARQAGVSSPGLALVTFFAERADARFDPENLALSYHNQFIRPAAIVPFTGNFSGRQLQQRQQATAIYLFEMPLPVYEQFDVVYGAAQSSWNDQVQRRIEVERARVVSKWQAARGDSAKQQ